MHMLLSVCKEMHFRLREIVFQVFRGNDRHSVRGELA